MHKPFLLLLLKHFNYCWHLSFCKSNFQIYNASDLILDYSVDYYKPYAIFIAHTFWILARGITLIIKFRQLFLSLSQKP
ncbi:MAG: hypothetical protein DRI75_09270 [Bacteroidetes bacterium]|nr:MAG: hypothetical protein DRI75_09270 [Bacteroidota bacterium]